MSSTPSDRDARRAKIQAAAPKESKLKPILAGLIALLVLAGVGLAIWNGTRGNDAGGNQAGGLPRGAQGEGQGILLNPTEPPAGTPVLDVYEDFQCPACAFFHKGLGKTVDELATTGQAKVVLHTKTFLDDNLGTDHSHKAANVAACAADAGPKAYMTMHDGIFASQPEKEGAGWPDMTFSDLATKGGITGEAKKTYDQCVKSDKYAAYVKSVEEQSAKDGVTSTPTYRLNGKDYDLRQVVDQQTQQINPQPLIDAVKAAKK